MGGEAANRIVKIEACPDNNYTAIAFLRGAGATTGFNPQVSILKKGEELGNESGNVFRGYRSDFIDIRWESNNTLIIIHNLPEKNIKMRKEQIYDINIKYEFRENQSSAW